MRGTRGGGPFLVSAIGFCGFLISLMIGVWVRRLLWAEIALGCLGVIVGAALWALWIEEYGKRGKRNG